MSPVIQAGDEVELVIPDRDYTLGRPGLRLKVLEVSQGHGAALPAMLRVRLPLADEDDWLGECRFDKVKDKDES